MWSFCFRSQRSSIGNIPVKKVPSVQEVVPRNASNKHSSQTGLESILALLESAATASKSVEICELQSGILCKVLKQVGQCIQQWRGILATVSDDTLAVENLVNSLDKGVQLLQSCQEQGWSFRALLHEESRNDFLQVTTDTLESLRLLSLALISLADAGQKQKITADQRQFLADFSDDPDGSLAAAADKDRTKLWEKVKSCNSEGSMIRKLLLRKCTESRSGIRDNIFIDFRHLVFKRQLSVGAYGTVHEASWMDYPFAVKVFREGDNTFSRELAALVPLNHPNIVRVVGYSYDDDNRRCALVMEKMSMDLTKFLKVLKRESRASLFTSVIIMHEIAVGMRLLHSENIIHRDLKPANILVNTNTAGGSFTIKVADFGFARTEFITKDVTHATSRVGTRSFRAPEVCDSEKYSKKADVYSFAMVCYQILAGEMPFLNISMNENFLDLVRDGSRPELPEGCSAELSTLLKQCWSGDPEERPDFRQICDMLKVLKGSIVTRCSWDEVKQYEVAAKPSGLQCFDGGGYSDQNLRSAIKNLGQGTCGVTHQAEISLANKGSTFVAVKRLKDHKAGLMSKQQFQILGKLSHKNVLPLRSYYCGDRECLLVYDYIPGPSLATAFHGSPGASLDWTSRIRIALSVAKGLAYLHSQPSLSGNGDGFVHGALHFSNIFIHEGEAVLADAGVSYINRVGAELSQTTDIYAFGVMLIELLTRKPPGFVRLLLQQKRTKEVFDEKLQILWTGLNKELVQMLRLAMACVSAAPPKMDRVAVLIEKLGVIRDDALPPGSALPS